jgi:hypothetical protein
MTKQERIVAVAAAIEQHKETTKLVNKIITDDNGTAYGFHYVAEIDSEQLAELLVEAGIGDLRNYRAKLIELYLKGQTAELLKFIMEEV